MLIPRETIYSTLFATWQTALAGQVQFFTRRPDVYYNIGMDSMPALLQVQRRETAMKASPNMPGYWRMEVQVLVYFATGADVLLHEVMHPDGIDRLVARVPRAPRLREALLAMHTTTKEVGKVAAEANVKTLVLNHFVPGDDLSITDEMWRADPSKDFDGLLVVGRDLQTI